MVKKLGEKLIFHPPGGALTAFDFVPRLEFLDLRLLALDFLVDGQRTVMFRPTSISAKARSKSPEYWTRPWEPAVSMH